MNKVKLAHSGKVDRDGKHHYTLGGTGKVYINGHRVEGVLLFTPNLLGRDEVASVTLTIAVSEFIYGPDEEYVSIHAIGDDVERRFPTMRD